MRAEFSTKVAFVAGGTGGLGCAVSLAFHEAGAQVIVSYRKPEEFELLSAAAGADGSRLEGHRVDVTDEAAVGQLIETALAQHGKLDALVNTVGGYAGGVKLWELETNVLDRMLALNLRSIYVLSRAAVQVMLKQRRGAIVNVAAKAAFDQPGGAAAYAASKECASCGFAKPGSNACHAANAAATDACLCRPHDPEYARQRRASRTPR